MKKEIEQGEPKVFPPRKRERGGVIIERGRREGGSRKVD